MSSAIWNPFSLGLNVLKSTHVNPKKTPCLVIIFPLKTLDIESTHTDQKGQYCGCKGKVPK